MRLHTLPILSIFLLAACEPAEPCSDDSHSEGYESGGWNAWSCCTCPERPEEDVLSWTCKLDDYGHYFVCYAEQCEDDSTDASTTSG